MYLSRQELYYMKFKGKDYLNKILLTFTHSNSKIKIMKKIITTLQHNKFKIFALLCIFNLSQLLAQPTCSVDPVFVASPKYGIWPDSATNFASGQVGVAYAQNITVKVPKDTAANPIRICFTRFELSSPNTYTNYNLPPGLNLTGTPASLQFPGNANSCAIISGTPTTAGTYTLHFQIKAYGNTILYSQTCPNNPNPNSGNNISTTTLDYYIINIAPATNVAQNNFNQNIQVYPQPATNHINISYPASTEKELMFKLSDITGKTILTKKLECNPGNNTWNIDVSDIQEGLYIYTITNGQDVFTNKILIQR